MKNSPQGHEYSGENPTGDEIDGIPQERMHIAIRIKSCGLQLRTHSGSCGSLKKYGVLYAGPGRSGCADPRDPAIEDEA
jgi:hypothetical protein